LVCGQFGPTTLVCGALNIWSLVVCGHLRLLTFGLWSIWAYNLGLWCFKHLVSGGLWWSVVVCGHSRLLTFGLQSFGAYNFGPWCFKHLVCGGLWWSVVI